MFPLNPTETKIRNLLLDFCNHHNTIHHPPLVLRFTGGWVRDKILGIDSNDIDVAINHLSGEDFATRLQNYLVNVKQEAVNSIHTIKKNPTKSKHLETCTTKIFDMDIDFVNLRSEAYSEDSRVPVIQYGTPQEDAMRRDATLNALFYNINEDKVEDFTGQGMKDLANGILRTPLAPLQTFLDDPLRVLRLIRFASRLNFRIAPETLAAMGTPEVKYALVHKISRERVGIEVEKIIASDHPAYGFQLINHAGLTDSILSFGDMTEAVNKMNPQNVLREIEGMYEKVHSNMINITTLYPVFVESCREEIFSTMESESDRRAFWYSICLYPFSSKTILQTNGKKKQATGSIAEIILRGGLKASNGDMEKVMMLIDNRTESVEILHNSDISRSDLGLFLRKFGPHQNLNILFNLFVECLQPIRALNLTSYEPAPDKTVLGNDRVAAVREHVTAQMAKYAQIVQNIKRSGLDQVHTMKVLIDGKQLSKELGIKPGPWMSPVNNEILVWQLDNPEKSKEECLKFVRNILPKYREEKR